MHIAEWRKIFGAPYFEKTTTNGQEGPARKKLAYSRILIARTIWQKPMNGQAATVVATSPG